VYDLQTGASLYVEDEAGTSLLSQISQTLSLDYRDSPTDPHSGFIIRLGNDLAGLGGDTDFLRSKIDATYFVPLDRFTGNNAWGFAFSAGTGYLLSLGGQQRIIDNFFLGGDNLRGFQTGGVGPHATDGADSLGGRFIWTQSSELHFPLPVSPDLGITGRVFVDMGSLYGINKLVVQGVPYSTTDYQSVRMSAGFGISWKTPFGLLNIDLGQPILKRPYDESQLFRFGFGTRF
jgi:outer membrane protein insertion porin family